jgi:superfamily II DNA/RNA helicase
MGFIPDIERVCKLVPFTRQTLFFSATMPPEITRLTEAFLHNPVRIEVARASTTASTIRQALVASHGHADKRERLRKLIREEENFKNAIIFCNRKRDVAILHRSLTKHGFSAGALHGDMDQLARMASLDAFKNGDVSLLVCSDVAARGLDIPDVSHVFNFDVPTHSEDYVHRIGRTGRAGRSGVAITIVTEDDAKYVDQIQRLIGKAIAWEGPGFAELPPPMETPRGHEHRRGGRTERSGRRERGGERGRRVERGDPRQERFERVEAEGPVAMGRPAHAPRRPDPEPVRARLSEERRGRPRRHHEDDGPPVVGLGDHVPSFLLRPVTLRPAKMAEE